MGTFDKFFQKYSYKFPKGYPDVNDPNDILLLENIIKELGIVLENPIPNKETSEAISFIKNKYKFTDDNIKIGSSNEIKILLPDRFRLSRTEVISDLTKYPDFTYEREGRSSIGRLRYKNKSIIYIKFLSGQGDESSGKKNESSFFNLINSKIKEAGQSITVILESNNKTLVYRNISYCKDTSKEKTTDYLKADTQLISGEKIEANISLKREDAIRWESSKTRFRGLYDNFIKKALNNELDNITLQPIEGYPGKYKLWDPKTNQVISRVIITNISLDTLAKDIIFGNDYPPTIVIKQNFENYNGYIFENNTLTISCSKIYTTPKEIIGTEDEPILAFSNHIGKPYGIELRTFVKSNLYKDGELKGNKKEIDYNQIS
jgi:hypothetical protein